MTVPAPDIVPVNLIVAAPVAINFALAITVPDIVSPAPIFTVLVSTVKLAGAVPEAAAAKVTRPLEVKVPEYKETVAPETVPAVRVSATVVSLQVEELVAKSMVAP